MSGRAISWSRKRGVDVGVAKEVLDPLLDRFSKAYIARVSGISCETLDRIDRLKARRVEDSTIRVLRDLRRALAVSPGSPPTERQPAEARGRTPINPAPRTPRAQN